MTWSNLRFTVRRSFVTMARNLPSFLFNSIFKTTPEVSTELYFVKLHYVAKKSWLFNHKRADFWLPNFIFFHLSASVRPGFHYTTNTTTMTQKQSDYKVEQSSFALIALF